ncbi:MAG: hypothetical protein OEW52_00615 [Thermoleophilia bacterium]|nr:hypothetical protein [Thermoleophilia bacterium]MDH4339002.1 hypothetical protein [Thermoleophilia bacterium]MDH5279631.1 hypothetical protein [Thermoleophilia bacterium]
MDGRRNAFGGRLVVSLGVLTGALAGAATFLVADSAVATRAAEPSSVIVEATHVPPLLTVDGERSDLSYDAYCIDSEAEAPEDSCDLVGSVFIRSGSTGPFSKLPLRSDGTAGRLVASVPEEITTPRKGFTYYAEIAAATGQAAVTLPSGGAWAPHQSLPLGAAIAIDLGRHAFGSSSRADERVAEVGWGDGSNDVGLEEGRNLTPIGASAFDVDPSGVVVVLDQAHRRVLRWRNGSQNPTRVPLAIAGTIADMALASDGSLYVLEFASRSGRTPLVRRFDSHGRELESTETAERTASQIRQGPLGPVILQQPSGQWMPAASAGSPIPPEVQRRRGRSGRPIRGGEEIVVLRLNNEIRVALVGPAGVRRSWRIASETALAEVQLAEPLGHDVVLVARVYTDDADEFVALVLGAEGLIRRISLDSADWAESAPLGRFRLVRGSLYQLGSTPAGAYVDRFDLEVR